MLSRLVFRSRLLATSRRFASSETTAPVVAKKGAGLFQRLSSFIVGAGLSALVTQFYIYNELMEGNKVILEKQKAIEKKLKQLEGKK
mmetsp:Transcript_8482/g.10880  ORF Transcript_8482/g.10880 Transcript_8482/m.10880 type:complete len:87 (+) Transcript_8482:113-373(+)